MSNTLILINDLQNIISIEKHELKNSKVFSFNIESHKYLEKKGVNHKIAEDYFSENERIKIFDFVVSFHNWYEKINELKELEFKGTNLLGLLDTVEFHTYLMNEIINFFTIKRIIETEKPDSIITTANFSEIVKSLIKNNIKLKIYSNNFSKKLQWDEITIKQNIGRLPISFNISRSNYSRIKKAWEKIVCSIFNLWFDFKKSNQKTILFLEFYPPLYKELLFNLQKHGFNIIFLNRRKPAVFDLKSIKLLRSLGGKIINHDDLLDSKQKTQIQSTVESYLKKIDKIFSNEEIFNNIFLIEGHSLWNIFKEKLTESYRTRMHDYLFFLIAANKIFKKIKISCILTLNEIGETEKSILAANKNKIPSILLEHGFSTFFPDSARFNILASYPNFRDKIAVWSTLQKNFLMDFHGIKSERILVTGSPRHDVLFNRNSKIKHEFTVLIAPTPITQIQGFDHTKIHLKFELVIRKICSILQKNHNVKIIVKIHPSQSFHNKIIQQTIKEIDQNIPIYLLSSVTELIEASDAVITITPEGWAPSTIILESLILKKPIMNIVLDDHFYDFSFVKQKAVLVVSPESNLDENITKILFDKEFRRKLITNGEHFIRNFLYKPEHASKCLSNEINSLAERN